MSVVMGYLLDEIKMSEALAKKAEEKISRYQDIREEFENWITNKSFIVDSPLIVGGYTAKDINSLAPFLDGLGVYNFLVTLREDPEKAKRYIDSGFKRK